MTVLRFRNIPQKPKEAAFFIIRNREVMIRMKFQPSRPNEELSFVKTNPFALQFIMDAPMMMSNRDHFIPVINNFSSVHRNCYTD
jgi:hypothetical protein